MRERIVLLITLRMRCWHWRWVQGLMGVRSRWLGRVHSVEFLARQYAISCDGFGRLQLADGVVSFHCALLLHTCTAAGFAGGYEHLLLLLLQLLLWWLMETQAVIRWVLRHRQRGSWQVERLMVLLMRRQLLMRVLSCDLPLARDKIVASMLLVFERGLTVHVRIGDNSRG